MVGGNAAEKSFYKLGDVVEPDYSFSFVETRLKILSRELDEIVEELPHYRKYEALKQKGLSVFSIYEDFTKKLKEIVSYLGAEKIIENHCLENVASMEFDPKSNHLYFKKESLNLPGHDIEPVNVNVIIGIGFADNAPSLVKNGIFPNRLKSVVILLVVLKANIKNQKSTISKHTKLKTGVRRLDAFFNLKRAEELMGAD